MGIRRHLTRARSGPQPPEGPSSFGPLKVGDIATARDGRKFVVTEVFASGDLPLTPPCNVGQISADGRVQAVKRARKGRRK